MSCELNNLLFWMVAITIAMQTSMTSAIQYLYQILKNNQLVVPQGEIMDKIQEKAYQEHINALQLQVRFLRKENEQLIKKIKKPFEYTTKET